MAGKKDVTYLRYLRKESVSQEFYTQQNWPLSINITDTLLPTRKDSGILFPRSSRELQTMKTTRDFNRSTGSEQK